MTASALLEGTALAARFGGVIAVDGVSVAIGETGTLCIVGPNGAGKSTLFNMLSGVVRPTAGRVTLAGADITGRTLEAFASLGIARKFQTPSVFDRISVRDNLLVAARGRDPSGGALSVDAILQRLNLEALQHRSAGTLAHGQKQWLEIGMAIVTCPRVMLLDEPTAGMGPEETDKTAALVKELAERFAVVVIEHDMAFVHAMACRTMVMHRGRVIADGAFTDIEHDPLVRDVYLGRR